MNKEIFLNKNIGIKVICNDNPLRPFEAVTASEVHPVTKVIGLDLGDSCPVTYLAYIDTIEVCSVDKIS